MSKLPWFKFYPTDWRADVALKLCSLAARGLWLEMICIMHEAGGYLEINGSPVSEPALAALSGTSPQEIAALLGELEGAGVCSRDRKGRLYSRRMLRDLKKSSQAKSNGRKGGNPKLLREGKVSSADQRLSPSGKRDKAPSLKPERKTDFKVGDKPQSPEARDQIPSITPKGVTSPPSEDEELCSGVKPRFVEKDGKKAERLPQNWEPQARDIDFASNQGLEEKSIATEALKFRNYWTSLGGRKACKLDWHRTWQNWIIRSCEARNGTAQKGGPSSGGSVQGRRQGGGQRQSGLELADVAARVLGRAQAQDDLSENGREF